jgi:glutathione S-transferase
MPELILHHFLISPFSEKVRLVLGYKQLSWQSVIVPSILPKPDVVALSGGYRRTPLLQIGADIYCDTALICEVLEQLKPMPSLYPAAVGGVSRLLAQWADTSLFWAAVAGPRDPARMYGGAPENAKAFLEDRRMMFGAMAVLPMADAAAACKCYLQRLSDTLLNQPFLLGAQPCIADFAAYHPLWLVRIREPAHEDILQPFPALMGWMDRMQALGHGTMKQDLDSTQAILAAAASEPLRVGHGPLRDGFFANEHQIAIGSRVSITAESFGSEVTEGELVAATRTHYSLRRHDERAGNVNVHFPRIGYLLKKI